MTIVYNFTLPTETPPTPDGYAVIVWLHSGDFNAGNTTEINPFHLVFKQKLIVVAVAHRMGILGFFTSMDGEAPGNFGLMDQSAALFWIKKNIALFGGNAAQITLMGHGAGAVAASLHLTSGDWSHEMFQRAIIMSGASPSAWAVQEARSYAQAVDQVANAFGCNRRPTAALMVCLRRLEAATLIEGSPLVAWGPIIDEGLSNTTIPFVASDPRTLLERRSPAGLRAVPTLLGFTNMEDALDVSMGELMEAGVPADMYESLVADIILNELQQLEADNETCGGSGGGAGGNQQAVLDALNFVYRPYPPVSDPLVLRQKYVEFSTERNFAAPAILLATQLARSGADTYVYRFDIKASTAPAQEGLPAWSGVPHRYDLIFVWGLPFWVPLGNGTAQWDNADKRVSEIIMTMWANFAKTGNPTQMGVYIKWDKFDVQQQGVLIIDRSFNMSDAHTLNYQAMQFWNDYYPRVVGYASQCCNVTESGATTVRVRWLTMALLMAVSLVLSA